MDDLAAIEFPAALAEKGNRRERRSAFRIAARGLAACDSGRATEKAVSLQGDELVVEGLRHRLEPGARILVVGAGKASLRIGEALEGVLGQRLSGGAIAVRAGEERKLARIEVLGADHPLPSESSQAAAGRLLEIAASAGKRDIVIACFTGGSSALASLPPAGVSSDEKRALHRLLLSSGIGIVEVNTVRKHVSGFKGGRLAEAVPPARLINLTVSDVADDHLDTITDPSVADRSRAADAIAVLRATGLWEAAPRSVREHLEGPSAESPRLDESRIQTVLLATGWTACYAMATEASALGLEPVVLSTTLEGEARQLGTFLGNLARHSAAHRSPFAPGTVLLGCGGESRVTLAGAGGFGGGGPNQEATIAAALEIEGAPVAALFLDTDGSDGGTENAGGIADGWTVTRAAAAGVDLRAALLEHRSGAALLALEDVLETGPTGTNVNDLFAIVVGADGA